MICKKCGSYVPDDAYTCERCGTFQDADSIRGGSRYDIRSIRQGRSSAREAVVTAKSGGTIKEYSDFEPYAPDISHQGASMGRRAANTYAAVKSPESGKKTYVETKKQTSGLKHNHRRNYGKTNWALIGLILCILALAAGVGYYLYMSQSDEGHRITARKLVLEATPAQFELAVTKDPLLLEEQEDLLREWKGIPANSYWEVAEEYLDNGDLFTALTAFQMADILDPGNYDGLLLKATTHEMLGDFATAETIYLDLCQNVSQIRTEAYTALIRIYQDQGRRPEAAEMMRIAHTNTGRENFRLLRDDYIPVMPEVNLSAGRYEIPKLKEDILITSPQGYDVYYTTDEKAVLPDEGTLTTDGVILPEEGNIRIRAVAVSGDLVSDPLSVSYTFFYPTPPAPKSSLAPNTYDKLYSIHLRPGKVEGFTKKQQKEMEDNLIYHYTIDGSTPTTNSPIYDGTPIQLPPGKVTLKAICVNQYGKESSILEVGYKFNVSPGLKTMYGMQKDGTISFENDTFGGFELNKTTQYEFENAFGKAKTVTDVTYMHYQGAAKRLDYNWGHAVFIQVGNLWQLARVEMTSGITSMPRGVGLGASLSEVTDAFKDFGQAPSVDGTRGLYFSYPNVGQYLKDEKGQEYVHYTAFTLDSKMWVLQYWLEDGRVKKIVHYYHP